MEIKNVRINGIKNPTGFHYDWLTCSWLVTAAHDKCQAAARILADMAQLLGCDRDADTYGTLAKQIKAAVLREYVTETGRLAVDTQAAYVLALKFGIYKEKQRLIDGFLHRIQMDCDRIKCGNP